MPGSGTASSCSTQFDKITSGSVVLIATAHVTIALTGQSGLCIGLRLRELTQIQIVAVTLVSVGLCKLCADASSNPHHGTKCAVVQEQFQENDHGDIYIRYFRIVPGHP